MIDFDCFGFCVLCHKNMLTEQVVDGRVIQRFIPEYTEEEFLLDNGSRMRVAMCKSCQINLSDKDYNDIMQCVIKGWGKELENNTWSKERKEQYHNDYYKLKIIMKSQHKTNDELKKELEDFKKKPK